MIIDIPLKENNLKKIYYILERTIDVMCYFYDYSFVTKRLHTLQFSKAALIILSILVSSNGLNCSSVTLNSKKILKKSFRFSILISVFSF